MAKAKKVQKNGKKIEAKATRKPTGETKFGKLRAALTARKESTAEELMKATGFDARNLKTAISILRNPKRSKNILDTTFDRERKVYVRV